MRVRGGEMNHDDHPSPSRCDLLETISVIDHFHSASYGVALSVQPGFSLLFRQIIWYGLRHGGAIYTAIVRWEALRLSDAWPESRMGTASQAMPGREASRARFVAESAEKM